MFPADRNRKQSLFLQDPGSQDRKTRVNKASPEGHIAIECVGDSRDASPSRTSASKPGHLEARQKKEPAPASVSTHSTYEGLRKKSILTTEFNPLYKEKLRQRLRLLFATDEDIASMTYKQAPEPCLGSKLTDSAMLETRMDALTKRVLNLETDMESLC
ncbi:hypothetical protein KR054_009625 [Drosophila jambulina]|nr:hypothetical protein KR054_009625 [Drosophila jambulina]